MIETTLNLIEVGYTGDLGLPWRRHLDKINYLLTFNPMVESFCKPKHAHFKFAVSDVNETKKFNVYKKEQCSSLFEYDRDTLSLRKNKSSDLDLVEVRDVTCVRLEDILSDAEIQYDFVKIDTQGSDLDVIKGLGNLLNGIRGIQAEVFFTQMYHNVPTANEIIAYLDKHDFVLMCNIRKENPLFGDYLFINKNAPKRYKKLISEVYGL